MSETNKSVFISYRRDVSAFIARAVFMDLRLNGWDVFMDVESIDSGAFDTVILNQIAARTHFVLILTPGSLDRCVEPDDWLRREIETAIELGRNIVPLLFNSFTFKDTEMYLTGKLDSLVRYNALNVPHDFFDAAMEKLRVRYLKRPVDIALISVPHAEQKLADEIMTSPGTQLPPTSIEIEAEEYLVDGFKKFKQGAYEAAIEDYDQAIRLNPDYVMAYNFRGIAYASTGELQAAIEDCSKAIELNPDDATAYVNRGEYYFRLGKYDLGLSDFEYTNTVKPQYPLAVAGLAVTQHALGENETAKQLWTSLVNKDARYNDANWVKDVLNWAEPLVKAARKLIDSLDETQ